MSKRFYHRSQIHHIDIVNTPVVDVFIKNYVRWVIHQHDYHVYMIIFNKRYRVVGVYQ